MLPQHNGDNFLFQIILIYRRTIPSRDLFYFIFFFFKFIGLYLLVHNISGQEDDAYSFETLLHFLTIMANSLTHISPYYAYTSIALFVFLVLFIAFCLSVFLLIRSSRNTSISLSSRNSNISSNLAISSTMQAIITCCTVVFSGIVFLSHFISEFLIFSLMPLIYSKDHISDSLNNPKAIQLELFVNRMQLNKYAIFVINTISLFIIMSFLAFFLYLSAYCSLDKQYGFDTNLNWVGIVILIACFQYQGIYTLSNYFFNSLGKSTKLGLCCFAIASTILCFCINLKQYNHSQNRIAYFINYVFNLCFIAGIVEVILSTTYSSHLTQTESVIKTVFEIINACILTLLVTKLKRKANLRRFVTNVFNQHNKINECNVIKEYAFTIAQTINKVDFILMYQLLEDHRTACLNEQCKCHKVYSGLQTKSNSNKNNINAIKREFIAIGENEIVSSINFHREKNSHRKESRNLYLIHVDYVKTIKGNYFLALYLAAWYQQSKHCSFGFFDLYFLYEMKEDIIRMLNERKGSLCNASKHQTQVNRKTTHKKTKHKERLLLLNCLFSERIINHLSVCLTEMERFAYYRNIVRMNMKTSIKSEEFLKPISVFNCEYNTMIDMLDDYFSSTKEIPSDFIQLSYLLSSFFILFNGEIPPQYKGRFNYFPKYSDYLRHNSLSTRYMILFLTNDDTIIIKLISIQLAEELSFTQKELIDNDIHDLFLPSHLSQSHFIAMKGFMLNGDSHFSKTAYLINSDKFLKPYHLSGKIMLSLRKCLSLIIEAKAFDHQMCNKQQKDEANASTYYLCLDHCFNLLAVSENFTKQFVFTLSMFKTLQINFCSFFGIKQEQVSKFFDKKLVKKVNAKGKALINSISTTVPLEKKAKYQTVLHFSYETKDRDEREVQVSKSRAVCCIKRLEKSIDELGLEKEWNDRLNDLCERLGYYQTETLGNSNIYHSCYPESKSEKLSFVFKFRNIGSLIYYIVIFQNKIPESALFKAEDDCRAKDNMRELIVSDKRTLIEEKAYLLNSNATSKETNYAELNSKKELNQSENNNSNALMLNNNSNALMLNNSLLHQKNDRGAMHTAYKDSKIAYKKIQGINQKANLLKIVQIVILFGLICFNVATFSINASFFSMFLNMFYISTYSFLLSADVFLTSLGCLRVCLIQEKIQQGSIDDFQETIAYYSEEMIEHFQLLLRYVHKMADSSLADSIYATLTEETDYKLLLFNWETTTRKSIFREEIFYFHYYLSTFDLNESKSCKLGSFFLESGKTHSSVETTEEERTIYYIIINVISKMSLSLHKLTQITDNQLNGYTESSKVTLISLQIIILFIGLTLYLSLIGYISLLKTINEIIMTQFLSRLKGEDEFNAGVERLKRLVVHFNHRECKQFEETKSKSSPYLMKFTDIVLNPSSMGPISFNSNQTSSLNINHESTHKVIHSKTKQNRMKHIDSVSSKKYQTDSELIEQYKTTIQRLSKMRFMNGLLFSISLLLIIFSGIQIGNILIVDQTFNERVIENIFTTYFLLRIPKFAELVLYTEISVIVNSDSLVIPDMENNLIVNYFNVKGSANDESFLNSLANKNFVFLYNQLYVIRQNLHLFLNDKATSDLFPLLQGIERKFQSKEFCSEVARVYTISLYDKQKVDLMSVFKAVSHEGQKCREFGSGINLSGLKIVFDLLIQHLYVLYVDFETKERIEKVQEEFLQDPMLELIIDSFQATMGNVHKSFAHFSLKDVIDSYNSKYRIEIIMGTVSLMVSIGVFSVLFIVMIKSFERHNAVLESFWLKIDKAIQVHQPDKDYLELSNSKRKKKNAL